MSPLLKHCGRTQTKDVTLMVNGNYPDHLATMEHSIKSIRLYGCMDGIWPITFAQTLFQAKALRHSDSSACISAHPKTKYLG